MSTFFKTLTLVLLGSFALGANAANEVDELYFDIMGSVAEPDSARGVEDGTGGIALRVGIAVDEYWNLEAALDNLDLEGDFSLGGSDLNQTLLGANALAVFNRGGEFSPFVISGIGYVDSDPIGAQSEHNFYWQAGIGAIVPIIDDRARFRSEILYRSENDSADSKDWILNIGFGIPFGGKPAPAPVVESDSDGDGVPDGRDRCPNTPRGARVDANGCEPDTDGDGVVDRLDQCPNTPAGARVDARGCELDSDGDGVVDSKDKCPGTPRGTKVDEVGCAIVKIVDLDGVNFRTNSADLLDGAEEKLDEQAAKLKDNPDIDIEVAGHTDSAGDASYNQGLSQRRAETVRQYLIDKGVAADRITAKGYGEAEPIASNDNALGMAENRRVELRIRKR